MAIYSTASPAEFNNISYDCDICDMDFGLDMNSYFQHRGAYLKDGWTETFDIIQCYKEHKEKVFEYAKGTILKLYETTETSTNKIYYCAWCFGGFPHEQLFKAMTGYYAYNLCEVISHILNKHLPRYDELGRKDTYTACKYPNRVMNVKAADDEYDPKEDEFYSPI